jgi:hypothetical protein
VPEGTRHELKLELVSNFEDFELVTGKLHDVVLDEWRVSLAGLGETHKKLCGCGLGTEVPRVAVVSPGLEGEDPFSDTPAVKTAGYWKSPLRGSGDRCATVSGG